MEKEHKNMVFIPGIKNENPFFDEITAHTKTKFVYGDLDLYKKSYGAVLIHWPEQLFNWEVPTEEGIQKLKNHIKTWKDSSKIIYVVNNSEPHVLTDPIYKELYKLVVTYCDIMVHLGEYSLLKLRKKYTSVLHQLIPHPLYEASFKVLDKQMARKKLDIPKNDFVMIAPGRIRKMEERTLIVDAFKSIPVTNKILLVPYMLKKKVNLEFKGRTKLKKLIDIKRVLEKLINYSTNKKHVFGFSFTSFEDLSLYMSAADIVFIPRTTILNSGNLFLGLTYQKVIVGPDVGNISEYLDYFDLPKFNANHKGSIRSAMEQAVVLHQNNFKIPAGKLEHLRPGNIAKKWDELIDHSVQ